jgi:hypothetical protein
MLIAPSIALLYLLYLCPCVLHYISLPLLFCARHTPRALCQAFLLKFLLSPRALDLSSAKAMCCRRGVLDFKILHLNLSPVFRSPILSVLSKLRYLLQPFSSTARSSCGLIRPLYAHFPGAEKLRASSANRSTHQELASTAHALPFYPNPNPNGNFAHPLVLCLRFCSLLTGRNACLL